ncbi:MAG: hypothetical protein WB686_17430 [Pseudolabrys sp.]
MRKIDAEVPASMSGTANTDRPFQFFRMNYLVVARESTIFISL